MQKALNLKRIDCCGYDYSDGQSGMSGVNVDFPTKCEHCKHVGEQREITSSYTFSDEYHDYRADVCSVIMITSCTYCNNHTIHLMRENQIMYPDKFEPTRFYQSFKTIPSETKVESLQFTDKVKELSENFIKIYTQSLQAESTGLDEIAGIGYRKALEFLVTDYLIKNKPEKTEFLKNPKTTLGAKIALLPEDLADYAKASSYLGNDETHYTRRHPEHGVQDLKAFIEVFIVELNREIAREKARSVIGKSTPHQENQ